MSEAVSEKPVVLVTGASAGIGDAIARRFAEGSWNIVALARRKERLEGLAASLAERAEVKAFAADVGAADSGDKAVAFAIEQFGRLDCLVNNAGSGIYKPPRDTSDAEMDEVIDISLKGPFRFARAALGVMKPGSSIVTVGSTYGIVGGLNGGMYCAVKAGLIGLTQSLAVEYGADGIRANLVAPGVIRTDMTEAAWDWAPFRRTNHEMTPFNREGTPQDIANAVYFLASDQGSYINGQTLALDGGWSTTKFLSRDALVADRVAAE
jgi:meso-butanediol dehydrogenase/(S,S)-butanediol dehydrogenase/diacetyl reductase